MTTPSTSLSVPLRQRLVLALVWAVLGAGATVAVLPYAFALAPAVAEKLPVSFPVFALAQALQMAVLLFALSFVGLSLGQPLGLDSPIVRGLVGGPRTAVSPRSLGIAALVGALAGAAIMALDAAFRPFMPGVHGGASPTVAPWKGLLASFYGGITEELLLRLFLMTLLAWVGWRVVLRGLEHAMLAHFSADIVIHVIGGT